MILKKSVIGLIVATSLASVSAHAWTNGDFNGNVNIGGNIANDIYSQKWAWSIGSGLDNFSNKISEMTENSTKLSITMTEDKAILLGKTNEAFWAPSTGVGAVPNISFTNYKGEAVTLENETSSGRVSFTLPVKDSSGAEEVGQLSVNAVAVGYMVTGASTGPAVLFNSMFAENSGNVFWGGIQTNRQNAIQSGKAAASKVLTFGGVSSGELIGQLQQVHSNIPNIPLDASYVAVTDWTRPVESAAFPDSVAAAGYALGIENGQSIDLSFNNQVTKTTDWVAPLNVQVTYQ